MNRMMRNQAAMTGALVADAAALGLHWLYDADHLARIAGDTPEFRTPSADDFKDVKGYFAHAGKTAGESSHYGTTLKIMLLSLRAQQGRLDDDDFYQRLQHWFGFGGQWQGYIDHPTRKTLANLAHGHSPPCGAADDTQMPALTSLPAIVARVRNPAELPDLVDHAVRMTNHNDLAVEIARHAALVLYQVLEGSTLNQALEVAGRLPGELAATYDALVALKTADANRLGEQSGRACSLEQGYPLLLGLLHHRHSFVDAVRANIWAGGDSCGRGILLGALAGALYGIGDEKGIPLAWLARVFPSEGVFEAIDFLSRRP